MTFILQLDRSIIADDPPKSGVQENGRDRFHHDRNKTAMKIVQLLAQMEVYASMRVDITDYVKLRV